MVNAEEILRARPAQAVLFVLGWLPLWIGESVTANAQTPPHVVAVEEDWELVVATPDPIVDAPQVTCVISPVGDTSSIHAAFEINHQSTPDFVPGGLQLQLWNDEDPLASRKYPNPAIMSQAGETVRWTQGVRLSGGLLIFEITRGASATWGAFGGQGYLRATAATTLANLNGYSPSVSAANSGVGYAANRVQSLVLRNVRLVTSSGEVLEASPMVSVYPKP